MTIEKRIKEARYQLVRAGKQRSELIFTEVAPTVSDQVILREMDSQLKETGRALLSNIMDVFDVAEEISPDFEGWYMVSLRPIHEDNHHA